MERLQRDLTVLVKEFPSTVPSDDMVTSRGESTTAIVVFPAEVIGTKPVAHEPVENGNSELGDSESGVSSMESFEGILRKENGHATIENGLKENGVSENLSANDDMDGDLNPRGGISVTPDEYQRIRMNQSTESNEDVTSRSSISLENGEYSREFEDGSRDTENKSRDANVPLLTVTDENGTPGEVVYAEIVQESGVDNADDESFPDQAGEFFIDDFDVYYGQTPSEMVLKPEKTSASDETDVAESERGTLNGESRVDGLQNGSQNSGLSDQEPDGALSDETSDLVLKAKHQTVESAVTEITLPEQKSVDALHKFDFSAYLETEELPRHSTPSELVVSTDDEGNAPLYGNEEIKTVEPLQDSTTSVNADASSTVRNDTRKASDQDEKRPGKIRKYEPSAIPSADVVSTESGGISGETDLQTGFVGSAPNEEMNKLGRLLNISDHESGNNVRDVEDVKPQEKIASILAARRKAEEAERLHFAESSVRDPDYELFTSRPLDLVDRSSTLKDLDESGSLLHEEMGLDEFLVEVEKLLEKLRSIEELITTDLDSEDNVKDELAKHVVSLRIEALIVKRRLGCGYNLKG